MFTDCPLGCCNNLGVVCQQSTQYCVVLGGGWWCMEFKKVPVGRSEIREICNCTKIAVAGKEELECNVIVICHLACGGDEIVL